MPDTQTRHDAWIAATVPWALTALGQHIIDHQLPTPWHIDIEGRTTDHPITVWVNSPEDADAWITTGCPLGEETREATYIRRWRHTAHVRLDGACLKVRVFWHTPEDDEDEVEGS